jgi:putative transposase
MAQAAIVPLGVKHKAAIKSASEPLVQDTRHNLLKKRNLTALRLHHLWAEDFTHLWFRGRWYYLATIIDHYSRLLVGWSLSVRHDTDLVVSALLDALGKHPPPAILHQDQGSEYCSQRYDIIALSEGIELSFSAKGHPWENGFQESFYHYFKIEIDADHLDRFTDEGELTEAIARQLHYYNTERMHSVLEMTPLAFSASGLPPRNAEKQTRDYVRKDTKLTHKNQSYFQQILTGVRDKVFMILGA